MPGERRYVLRFPQILAIAALPALIALVAGFAWGHVAAMRSVAVQAEQAR